jgi:hypothetical protein
MDIAAKLRAFREYYRASKAELRERRMAGRSPLYKWLGMDKPRTTTGIVLFVHSVIATGLYIGTFCLLAAEYVAQGKAFPHGAIFFPFVLPAIYLAIVHALIRRGRAKGK